MNAVAKLLWVSAQRLVRGRIAMFYVVFAAAMTAISTSMLSPGRRSLLQVIGLFGHGVAYGLMLVFWGSVLLTAMQTGSPNRVRLMPNLRGNLLLALCLVQSVVVLCDLSVPLVAHPPHASVMLTLCLQLLVGWTLAAPVWGAWLGLLALVYVQMTGNWRPPDGAPPTVLLILAVALFISMWTWIGNGSTRHRKRYQAQVNALSEVSRFGGHRIVNRDSGRSFVRTIARALWRRLPPNANEKQLLAYGVLPRWSVRYVLAMSLPLLGFVLYLQMRHTSPDPTDLERASYFLLFPLMSVVGPVRGSLSGTHAEQALIRLGAKAPVTRAINPALLSSILLPAVVTQVAMLTIYAAALFAVGEDLTRLSRMLVLLISASAWQLLPFVRRYASMKLAGRLPAFNALALYMVLATALIFGRERLMYDSTMVLAALSLVLALAANVWAVRRVIRGPVCLPVGRLA